MLYDQLLEAKKSNNTLLAILFDPDKCNDVQLHKITTALNGKKPHVILVGGSLISNNTDNCIEQIRKHFSTVPIILFPGDNNQISHNADGLLFLQLISGRNPEYLIGQHVKSALNIKKLNIEVIPTGYILIDGGCTTSVQYISNTTPIPNDKPDIALATAVAGELLGLKTIYLEAGSGAQKHIPAETVKLINQNINIPLIVGGGIRNIEDFKLLANAGAQMIVVGTAIEKDPSLSAKLL